MKMQLKKQLVYWANIILLTVNITLLISLFPGSKDEPPTQDEIELSNEFIKSRLGFTEEQFQQLAEADREVQYKYQVVLKLLCQNRYCLLNELAKPYPSEVKMDSIAEKIGFLHRALKKQTIEHLMNIKKNCTQEQTGRLNEIFRQILDMDHYCPFCKEKCSVSQKNKRYPVFFPYDHEAEKRMREQLSQHCLVEEPALIVYK